MGRRGRNGGHRGHGYTRRGRRRGRGRGQNYSGTNIVSKKGICTDLGNNVFYYSHKAAADHMRTPWEELVQYVGTKYGQDIRNELNGKVKVKLVTSVHLTEVLLRHATWEALVRTYQLNIQESLRAQAIMLRSSATADPSDAELPTKISIMDNNITKVYYDLANKISIEMSESEKTAHGNKWRTYR